MASYYQVADKTEIALGLFNRAIELDADFASAYAMGALCYLMRKAAAAWVDPKRETADAVSLARRAMELGKDDAHALAMSGVVLAHMERDISAGVALTDRGGRRSIRNRAAARVMSGFVRTLPLVSYRCILSNGHHTRYPPKSARSIHAGNAECDGTRPFFRWPLRRSIICCQQHWSMRKTPRFHDGFAGIALPLAMRLLDDWNRQERPRDLAAAEPSQPCGCRPGEIQGRYTSSRPDRPNDVRRIASEKR